MEKTVTLSRVCPLCGCNHWMVFGRQRFEDGMKKYKAGALIQNAFPDFTASEREFILTGICDTCWNDM